MVSVRYRKDRRKWEVDYRENGSRNHKHFSSEKTAREFAQMKEEQLERKRAGMLYLDMVTFEEYAEIFKENHFRFLSPGYAKMAKTIIDGLFIPHFGEMFMHQILRSEVERFRDIRIAAGGAPKTIINTVGLLNKMFDRAIANRFALDNPVEGVSLPRNVPRRLRDAIPIEQVIELCRHCRPELMKAILILVNTGIRTSELISSKGADYDTVHGWMTVRSVEGKTTKNYRTRRVPIPKVVCDLLVGCAPDESPCCLTIPQLKRGFQKARKKIGATWQLHELRHTYISQQLKAGVDKRTLREWVGHQSDQIIDKYSHYIPGAHRAEVNIGSDLLAGQATVVTMRSPVVSERMRNQGDESWGARIRT